MERTKEWEWEGQGEACLLSQVTDFGLKIHYALFKTLADLLYGPSFEGFNREKKATCLQ